MIDTSTFSTEPLTEEELGAQGEHYEEQRQFPPSSQPGKHAMYLFAIEDKFGTDESTLEESTSSNNLRYIKAKTTWAHADSGRLGPRNVAMNSLPYGKFGSPSIRDYFNCCEGVPTPSTPKEYADTLTSLVGDQKHPVIADIGWIGRCNDCRKRFNEENSAPGGGTKEEWDAYNAAKDAACLVAANAGGFPSSTNGGGKVDTVTCPNCQADVQAVEVINRFMTS